MNSVIIFKSTKERVSVLYPTKEALEDHTIKEIAVKDVPEGKPFAIVDTADLPSEPQETWTVDEADLTDGVGGKSNEFSPSDVIEGDADVTG